MCKRKGFFIVSSKAHRFIPKLTAKTKIYGCVLHMGIHEFSVASMTPDTSKFLWQKLGCVFYEGAT